MWVNFKWIIDRLKYFKSEFNTQGRRGEMVLRRWAVGPLGRWAVREHFVFGAYLRKYLSDCLQISHTAPLGGLVVPFGVYEL